MAVTVTNKMSRLYAFGQTARLVPNQPTPVENPADIAELKHNKLVRERIAKGLLVVTGLDEVGDVPAPAQVATPPVDQSAEIERLKQLVEESKAAQAKAEAEKAEAEKAQADAEEAKAKAEADTKAAQAKADKGK